MSMIPYYLFFASKSSLTAVSQCSEESTPGSIQKYEELYSLFLERKFVLTDEHHSLNTCAWSWFVLLPFPV